MNYEIVTDSCCNLPEELIEKLNLHILPLTFMVDEVQYQGYTKGQHTDLKQFYDMMREGKVVTTSLPNMADTKDLLESILKREKDVLYLGFSSGLSGTYEAVKNLMKDLEAEYPERTLLSVDTLNASLGEGLLVYKAALKAQKGESIHEVKQWAEGAKPHTCAWFTVDDLMFLYRGGRVSKTSAYAGSLLNIKPVLHVDDEGHLVPMEKTSGRKKSIKHLLQHMEQLAYKPVELVGITHGDCAEDLEFLKGLIVEKFGPVEIITNYVDPVIGAHSGPGTLALFFMGEHR